MEVCVCGLLTTGRLGEGLLRPVLVRLGGSLRVGNLGIRNKTRAGLRVTLLPVARLGVALLPVARLSLACLWVAGLPVACLRVAGLADGGRVGRDERLVVIGRGRGNAKAGLRGAVDVGVEWVALPHDGVATLILGHGAVLLFLVSGGCLTTRRSKGREGIISLFILHNINNNNHHHHHHHHSLHTVSGWMNSCGLALLTNIHFYILINKPFMCF